VVEVIEGLHVEVKWPYRRLCVETQVAYSSCMRWKGLLRAGKTTVRRPGPGKTGDHTGLEDEVRDLKHRQAVTLGSGQLYKKWNDKVSRREFQWMVSNARAEANRARRAQMPHVEWNMAGLAWAMDDTGKKGLPVAWAMSLHQSRDLASRKGLAAIVSERLLPEGSVAETLEEQFERYGPPLFFKRDNGSNLNGGNVNDLFDEWIVMALNSPTYYPQYNGQLERFQRELKGDMAALLEGMDADLVTLQMAAAYALAKGNRSPRRCLRGKVADDVFETGQGLMKTYTPDKRREVRDEIMTQAMKIMAHMDKDGPRAEQAAWRIAVETWLRRNGLITVSVGGRVLPHSASLLVS
jgi:hypothetical protein